MQALSTNVWNVIDTVNLYHTGIGFCDWQIHLCEEGILAIPEGMKNTIAAGVAGGISAGAGVPMYNPLGKALRRGGTQQITDEGEPKWMRFPLDQIQAIVVRRKMLTGSRLFIELADGTRQKFATDNINATHQARCLFALAYKDLYREEKFRWPPDPSKALRELPPLESLSSLGP
jgi:hypothetical protein